MIQQPSVMIEKIVSSKGPFHIEVGGGAFRKSVGKKS